MSRRPDHSIPSHSHSQTRTSAKKKKKQYTSQLPFPKPSLDDLAFQRATLVFIPVYNTFTRIQACVARLPKLDSNAPAPT
jgi:hypothetical protein